MTGNKSKNVKVNLSSPYFFALDVDSDSEALELAQQTKKFVGGFKLGPRLCYRYGAPLIEKISTLAPVFVDNKYHDIPSTMLAALRASFEAGASFATVHAACGREALLEVARLEEKLNEQRPFQVLAVTVLTSLDAQTLPSNWREQSIAQHVVDLAGDVMGSGLSGLVCSPLEVAEIQKIFPHSFLVVPGIRIPNLAEIKNEDQSRVATPELAFSAGASALVIGRAILQAADPGLAAQKICAQLAGPQPDEG